MKLSKEALYGQSVLGSRQYGYKYRCQRKVAREIVEYGMFFYMGKAYFPYAKSVGCGIYEVFCKEE